MRYVAVAVDFDGTLAHHGVVDEPTQRALVHARQCGRRLILVTGREIEELLATYPGVGVFDRVVAENGAVLYRPETHERTPLAGPPDDRLVSALRALAIQPLSIGHSIVATREPHHEAVLGLIHDLGLELQVIFNKGAVMVLPTGINKATGLEHALKVLGLSHHNVVGIGDAENDHALLGAAGCAVAVANALPALKERAHLVTRGERGAGVIEALARTIDHDLAEVGVRRRVLVGRTPDLTEVLIDPEETSFLIAGTSGSGKSTLITAVLEQLDGQAYQYAVVDPEGDYTNLLDGAIPIGDVDVAPRVHAVLDVLKRPGEHAVIDLLAVRLEDRPTAFGELLPALVALRRKCARPHLIVVDEAHHLLPAAVGPVLPAAVPATGVLYSTVHPEAMMPAALASIGVVMILGQSPAETLAGFCRNANRPHVAIDPSPLPTGMVWFWRIGEPPVRVRWQPPAAERRRHSSKYAEGNLGPERNFVFSGPDGKLNLRAQNLTVFLQMADGVDDETWQYHLLRQDYSRWFRTEIKDCTLADAAAAIERGGLSIAEARARLRDAVRARYTLPADKPSGEVT
jgi:hydroxymethylpyrimidine pyrophosphatase-like HAD family hydrolase